MEAQVFRGMWGRGASGGLGVKALGGLGLWTLLGWVGIGCDCGSGGVWFLGLGSFDVFVRRAL